MVMENITLEQLIAQGLSEEEAKIYLNNLKMKNQSSSQIPFDIAKVSYIYDMPETVGQLIAGIEKDDEGNVTNIKYIFGKKPEVRILSVMGQYTKTTFENDTLKTVISSTIYPLKEIRKAVDIKTGKPIIQLKEKDKDIKLNLVVLMEAKDIKSGEWIPVIMFMKGAFMYYFNQNVKPEHYMNTIIKFELMRKRKGQVSYFIPDNFEFIPLTQEEMFKKIKIDADNLKKFYEWIENINALANQVKEMSEIEDEVIDELNEELFK